MDKKYLVIDVGGTFTKYAVMDEECQFYCKDKVPTVKTNADDFIEMIVGIFHNTEDIAGIAISQAGVIDSDKGFLYNGGSLTFLQNLNLTEKLQKRCKVPVTVENDARCAGLAEIWKGSLSDCNNAIALIIGTAVGEAMIVDRKVLKGKHCMAGEFSYVLTNAEDAENSDKTLAMRGGMPALIRIAAEALGIPENQLSGEEIFRKANEGEAQAMACVRKFARTLAVQINNAQFLFDPERIAIGGGVSAQPLLIQFIREELAKFSKIYPHKVPSPEITTCRFFNDSNLIGALYVHLKAQEVKIDVKKVQELLELVGDRREGAYLRELFS